MKKLAYLLVLLLFTSISMADEIADTIANFKQSPKVSALFSSAYGYAIFPTIGKGGIGIGGAYGSGSVFKKGVKTGETSMTQLTIGFQLGGQAFSEVILF